MLPARDRFFIHQKTTHLGMNPAQRGENFKAFHVQVSPIPDRSALEPRYVTQQRNGVAQCTKADTTRQWREGKKVYLVLDDEHCRSMQVQPCQCVQRQRELRTWKAKLVSQ